MENWATLCLKLFTACIIVILPSMLRPSWTVFSLLTLNFISRQQSASFEIYSIVLTWQHNCLLFHPTKWLYCPPNDVLGQQRGEFPWEYRKFNLGAFLEEIWKLLLLVKIRLCIQWKLIVCSNGRRISTQLCCNFSVHLNEICTAPTKLQRKLSESGFNDLLFFSTSD